ncbi:CGNR zinc finger domain-containing protein [Ilumatobacter sp.]|uniref:CGNR zinc finger domain-containing protein n=1 Tax=Ilumatobacter sp. TaxID=1967498 RepID=UPI003B52740E
MYVTSAAHDDHRITLDVMVDIVNALGDDDLDVRALLVDAGFSRAGDASVASMQRVVERMAALSPFLADLPTTEATAAASRVTEELTELPINPSIVDHGDIGPHIHWTPPTARFDDQMMADVMMALAQEICDNGTIRFGTCDASGCDHLFYDSTRNRSKRFCADPRCASRTHTASHRRRRSAARD